MLTSSTSAVELAQTPSYGCRAPAKRGFPDHRDAENREEAGCGRLGPDRACRSMAAGPASLPDSKTSSMIRSSPVRWTSIRSWTSSRAATFEPPPGIWSSSPTRVPSCRIFSWNSFSLSTLLLVLVRLRHLDWVLAEHRRMMRLQHLAVAQIHVHAARQARIEAATARMMSMPLNLSGPFSSKIGVFCTASSYGPGVP